MLAGVSMQETPLKTTALEKELLNMKHHMALGGDNKPVVTDAWSTNRKHVLLMEVLSSVWRNHDSSALKNCLQQEEQIVWHL